MRIGRVLPDSVRQSASALWQAALEAALAAHRLVASHRAALLRAARRQDADRDAHPRHAPVRIEFQLAVHAIHVTV